MVQQQAEAPQFNIELPEEIAQGEYSNLVLLNPTQGEFVFDFVRLLPGVQTARVHSRQILTPANAKRLHRQLANFLEGYERELGTIELPEDTLEAGEAN